MNTLHLIRGKALLIPVNLFADDAETVPLDLTGYTFAGAVHGFDGVQVCPLTITIMNALTGSLRIGVSQADSAALLGSAYLYRVDITDPTGLLLDFGGDLIVTPV